MWRVTKREQQADIFQTPFDIIGVSKKAGTKMKKIAIFVSILFLTLPALAGNDLDKIMGMMNDLSGGTGLSNDKIGDGLAEALRVGTEKAVNLVSQKDGYLDDFKIKIPMPEDIRKVEQFIRLAGMGPKLDDFIVSMNRAAEEAAPQALKPFQDAIKTMTFDDARRILKGAENEATMYFKEKTYDQLITLFKPIINETMTKVGVTKAYKDLEKSIPVGQILGFNLDDYVTEKALDGLFAKVADEEKRIRKDPAARITDLLRDVFGNKN